MPSMRNHASLASQARPALSILAISFRRSPWYSLMTAGAKPTRWMTTTSRVGGIATIDDVMEFLVAGASAVQIGTANFYDPTVTMKILDALPAAVAELDAKRVVDVVGTLDASKQ